MARRNIHTCNACLASAMSTKYPPAGDEYPRCALVRSPAFVVLPAEPECRVSCLSRPLVLTAFVPAWVPCVNSQRRLRERGAPASTRRMAARGGCCARHSVAPIQMSLKGVQSSRARARVCVCGVCGVCVCGQLSAWTPCPALGHRCFPRHTHPAPPPCPRRGQVHKPHAEPRPEGGLGAGVCAGPPWLRIHVRACCLHRACCSVGV